MIIIGIVCFILKTQLFFIVIYTYPIQKTCTIVCDVDLICGMLKAFLRTNASSKKWECGWMNTQRDNEG